MSVNNLNLHFVVSAPRSGSTWLATALNHHPEIFATEHRLLGRFCEVWKNNDGSSAPRITFDSYARAFAMHYFYGFMGLTYEGFVEEFQREFAGFLVDFAQTRTGKTVVIDKVTPYPGTARLVIQQIKKLYPSAQIVQLVRDGRDVTTSGTFDWLLKDATGTDRHEFFVNRRPKMTLERFFDDSVIEKWALNWLESTTAFHGQTQIARLSYEAMKSNLAIELQQLFEVLGVAATPEIAQHCAEQTTFEKMAGRSAGDVDHTAKARKGVVGDWRNYFTRADGELFHRLAGTALIELGYERDDQWFERLPMKLELGQND